MGNKTFIITAFLLFLIGCTNIEKEITVIPVYPENSIKEFEAGIYLSDLRTIQEKNGKFFLNSYSNEKVYVTDSDLVLLHVFGEGGSGPGEFRGISSLYVFEDSVYVYDDGGSRLNVFTVEGHYKRTLNVPYANLLWERFAILDDKIYFAAHVQSPVAFVMANLISGEVIKEIDLDSELDHNLTNRTIISYKNHLIMVDKVHPFIERVSADGELLEVFDLTKINVDELDGLWKHYENNKEQNHILSFTSIFLDAYVDGSFLYVLCSGWPGRDDYSYIIKLQLNNRPMELQNVFKIQGESPSASLFQSIAVSGEFLAAIEGATQTVNVFDLSGID